MPRTRTKIGLTVALVLAALVVLYARLEVPAIPEHPPQLARHVPIGDTVTSSGSVATGSDSAGSARSIGTAYARMGLEYPDDSAIFRRLKDSLVKVRIAQAFLGGEVANELAHDRTGQVVLATDSVMGVGRVSTVVIAVSADTAEASVQFVRKAEASSRTTGSRVGRFMTADLHGAHFTIVPRQKPEQLMYEDSPMTWEFDVMPTESGPQTLSARVARRVKVSGSDELHSLPSTNLTVRVEKTVNSPFFFINEHQTGAWSTLVSIAVGLFSWFSGLIDRLRGKTQQTRRATRVR